MPIKNGWAMSFRKLSQNADFGSSIFRKESEAPIANSAPGVAACPNITRNSLKNLGI